MTVLHELAIIKDTSDIDWSRVKQTVALPDKGWMAVYGGLDQASQYIHKCQTSGEQPNPILLGACLQTKSIYPKIITLEDGLRYIRCYDAQTGEERFNVNEYGGQFTCDCGALSDAPCVTQASALDHLDLGDDWVLSAAFGIEPKEKKPGLLQTVAKKEKRAEGDTVIETMEYTVSPHTKQFAVEYNAADRSNGSSITIHAQTKYDQHLQQFSDRLTYIFVISEVGSDRNIQLNFNEEGVLEEAVFTSKEMRNVKGSVTAWIDALLDRDTKTLFIPKDQLYTHPAVKRAFSTLFGIDFDENTVLDRRTTLLTLLERINSDKPTNIRELLICRKLISSGQIDGSTERPGLEHGKG